MAADAVQVVEIEGHTSIRRARVELRSVNVLIGANGAGKSNFIRAMELLGRIVDQQLASFVARNGGASLLINRQVGQGMRLAIDFPPNGYEATFEPTIDDALYFTSETCTFRGVGYSAPCQLPLGEGHKETRLHVNADGHPVARHVIEKLQKCRVFHFHDTSAQSPIKMPHPTGDNLGLHGDGRNIAAVLASLRDSVEPEYSAAYRRLVGVVRHVAPFFGDFVLQPEGFDRIRLRWREVGSDTVFSAHQMSDGTLRFVCLATLLLHPALPALVVLDEPELGLHPYAITQLAELLRQASLRSQVLLATQSVTLINEFELEDLIVVERVDGASTFSRPDRARLAAWLDDYSLGELWQKNLIGGRPGPGGRGIA